MGKNICFIFVHGSSHRLANPGGGSHSNTTTSRKITRMANTNRGMLTPMMATALPT